MVAQREFETWMQTALRRRKGKQSTDFYDNNPKRESYSDPLPQSIGRCLLPTLQTGTSTAPTRADMDRDHRVFLIQRYFFHFVVLVPNDNFSFLRFFVIFFLFFCFKGFSSFFSTDIFFLYSHRIS